VTDGVPDFTIWREGGADTPFTVCAFFTRSYLARAERLAASLDALELPYAIFETPAVHRSISRHGVPDARYSKPRFIAFCLARFERPILYVDCDVVFRAHPVAVAQAVLDGADFAAFNWMAAPVNDAWMPASNLPPAVPPRFWAFAFQISRRSSDQLMTSGAVQFWGTTPAARVLLQDWEAAIARFARAPDDHALDFAFNRGNARQAGIRAAWLPATHVRYAFWPYMKPVIDHPDIPSPPDSHFTDLNFRFDFARLKDEPREPVFPRDLVLDAQERLLLRPGPQGALAPVAPLPSPLFLDDVN
jgi:hypothetical protein